MNFLYEIYVLLMVWFGAAPPTGYEHLLSETEKINYPSWWVALRKEYRLIGLPVVVFIVAGGAFYWILNQLARSSQPSNSFPSIQQTIDYNGNLGLAGPLILCISAIFWLRLLIYWRLKVTSTPHPIIYLFAFGTLFFGILTFFITCSVIADLLSRFDPNQVIEMQVKRLDKDGCQQLVINDKAVITAGFRQLKTAPVTDVARVWFWSKEGYQIHLTFSDFALHYHYLLIYKYKGNGEPVKAVVPTRALPSSSPRYGFVSPEFHRWVEENIDPYFRNCQP